MYLIAFNKILPLLIFTSLLFVCGCSENRSDQKTTKKERNLLSLEKKIEREVEADLDINAAEKYDIQLIEEYIDPDTLIDVLVLVNRKEWAHKKADKKGNTSFMKKTGYVGPYNYVYVKLGNNDKLLKAPPVGSSANIPLEHQFLQLTSQAHKDFFVEYRVRNSIYRNYYTVRDDQLYLTFNCPLLDSIGEPEPRVFAIKHQESTVRIAKDIALYEGKIVGYDHTTIEDPETYDPEQIIPLPELYVFFLFDEKTMKYKTPMIETKE